MRDALLEVRVTAPPPFARRDPAAPAGFTLDLRRATPARGDLPAVAWSGP